MLHRLAKDLRYSQHRSTDSSRPAFPKLLAVWHERCYFRGKNGLLLLAPVYDDVSKGKYAHGNGDKFDPIGQFQEPEIQPGNAAIYVNADATENEAEYDPSALRSEPCTSVTAATSPSTISAKYSAGPKLKAKVARTGAKPAMSAVPTVPAKNEPTAAMAQGRTGPPVQHHAPDLKEAYESVTVGYAYKDRAETEALVQESSAVLTELSKKPDW